MRKDSYIYILASNRHGTLYVGVTSDLVKRISEHKSKQVKGFSKKYNVTTLVYYEVHAGIEEAIIREKAIKAWKRKWKLELIEKNNPQWKGLYEEICG
jgi:putative endonuclease